MLLLACMVVGRRAAAAARTQGTASSLLLARREEGCRAWGGRGVAGMLQSEADGMEGSGPDGHR
jgi:hypothetical protein